MRVVGPRDVEPVGGCLAHWLPASQVDLLPPGFSPECLSTICCYLTFISLAMATRIVHISNLSLEVVFEGNLLKAPPLNRRGRKVSRLLNYLTCKIK